MRCNFESLCCLLNDSLNEKRKAKTLAHLRECEICMDAVLMMMQERPLARIRGLRILEEIAGEKELVATAGTKDCTHGGSLHWRM